MGKDNRWGCSSWWEGQKEGAALLRWWLPNQTNVRKNRTEKFSANAQRIIITSGHSSLRPAPSSLLLFLHLKLGLFLLSVSCLGLLCALFCCRNLKLTRHLPDKQTEREREGGAGREGRLTERLMCNNYPKLICLFAPARQSVKVELANRPTHLPFIQSCPTFSPSPFPFPRLLQMSVIMGGAHGASFGKFRAEFPCGSLCE